MDFWIAAITLTAIGCGTSVVVTVIDKFAGGVRRRLELELKTEQERAALTQKRVSELEEDNQRLRQQLEWHSRLLETQGGERRSLSEHGEQP